MVVATAGGENLNKKQQVEKLDEHLDIYFSRVQSNLHVVVLADFPGLKGQSAFRKLQLNLY